MIISKTPLRLSLAGGGTDLPEYYSKFGSHVVTSAIDKHIYIFLNNWFNPKLKISYSKTEIVDSINKIQHPVIRESFKYFNIKSHMEMAIMADLPARSGMGSSSSFAVGLINILSFFKKKTLSAQQLAEFAFKLQHNVLKEAGGKQDQYATAFGGILSLKIKKNGNVTVEKLNIKSYVIKNLEERLLCFYTGTQRSAPKIQQKYCDSIKKNKINVLESLHKIKKISPYMISNLKKGNIDEIGHLFEEHWQAKKSISNDITNDKFNKIHDEALKAGAIGGKMLGAGGGGYLVFICKENNRNKIKNLINKKGLIDIPIKIDNLGSSIYTKIQ